SAGGAGLFSMWEYTPPVFFLQVFLQKFFQFASFISFHANFFLSAPKSLLFAPPLDGAPALSVTEKQGKGKKRLKPRSRHSTMKEHPAYFSL
ncbi:MAG: hypothetical protein J6J81_02400, partial [Oscillospiraceae bacterium]|nr:hypothetical protein [Oscillospiraceae bacterium]